MNISKILRKVLALLFPPRCPVCDNVSGMSGDGVMCEDCRLAFAEDFVSICPVCGYAPDNCRCVPDVAGSEWDRSPFTKITPLVFSGYYTGYREESPVSKAVYGLKRDISEDRAVFFARIIAEAVIGRMVKWNIPKDDFIVTYIPRSSSALAEYGLDHMRSVAKHTAKMLGCRFEPLLIRHGGESQKELAAEERKANAYNTVEADPRKRDIISGAVVIVVDDVVTTGATMRAAVSQLSFNGAEMIIPAAAMISLKGKSFVAEKQPDEK